ncbi:MAG: hypothetical protein Kow0060_15080 [Methylohalobius crimeensis]
MYYGSEYINHQVAKLLEKLRIEQTKSRSRQTNDNALAESKNASTVRKYLGYSHIPQHFASQVNAFTLDVLSPYLNFHRPCHFPTEYTDKKGKIRKRYLYQDMKTPYEKLRSLPEAERYLKPGTTLKKLDTFAAECSDNEAAQHLNEAQATLFQLINKSQQSAA